MIRHESTADLRHRVPVKILVILTAILVWQLACVLMRSLYIDVLERRLLTAYTQWLQDLEPGHAAYARLSIWIELLAITLPSTILTLVFFNSFDGRLARRKQLAVTFCAWQVSVTVLLVMSYEFGLAYKISQIDWTLFGQPANQYGFRNVLLPRIIAWLLCTMPAAWLTLHGLAHAARRFKTRAMIGETT